MTIKQANTTHAGAMLNIQHKAFYSEAEIHNDFTIPPLTQMLESLVDDFKEYTFYIAIENNDIVGSVRVQLRNNNSVLFIGRLIVLPEHQGRGIGKQLMAYVEAKYQNVKEYELFTAEKSERNIYFYQKLGYKITSKFLEPGHGVVTLVRMVKDNQ